MNIRDAFRERLERDVARIMRHLIGSEMNPGELDGEIVLTVKDGKLANVDFLPPDPQVPPALDGQGYPMPKKRRGKVYEAPKADE